MIDTDGRQVGIIDYQEALKIAAERNLDLIEITHRVSPPVFKLGDKGKQKYLETKELKKQRQKQSQDVIKTIQIGFNEGEHDLAFKRKRVKEFLSENKKVEIILRLKGREKAHQDLALKKFNDFINSIDIPFKIIQERKSNPSFINIILKK